MKRLLAVRFVVALAFTMISGCSTTGNGVATSPSTVDWTKTAAWYNEYVVGLASVGLGVAGIAYPKAAPAIAIAAKEVANLNTLLEQKAGDATVQAQISTIDQAIADANAKFVPVPIPAGGTANPSASALMPTK